MKYTKYKFIIYYCWLMACQNLHSSKYTRKYFYLKNSSSFVHRRLLITSDIADIFSTNPSICTYFYLCQPVEILTSSPPMLYTFPLIDIRSFMAYEKSVQTSILKVYNFSFHVYVQYSITRGRLFQKDYSGRWMCFMIFPTIRLR